MKKHNLFFAALVTFGLVFSTYTFAETPAKDQKNTIHQSSTKPQAATQNTVKKVATKTTAQHKTTKPITGNKNAATKSTAVKKSGVNQKKQTAKQNFAKKPTTKPIASSKNSVKPKVAGTRATTHHLTKNHNKKKVIKQKQTSAT